MKNETVKINNQDVAVIEWNGERVITTAQLADVYEASKEQIKQNFNNMKSTFRRKSTFIY